MGIQAPKILRFEDFKPEERELIEKLGDVINKFNDDVYQQFNGNIGFSSLNRQLVKGVVVQINSAGEIANAPQIKIKTRSIPTGLNVIFAENITNSNTYPISHPFISFVIKNDLITFTNITGLQNNSRYKLNIEVIAD